MVARKIRVKVITRLSNFTRCLLINVSNNPEASATLKPIKAISRVLSGVKLIKFLAALLTIYFNPS